MCFVPSLFFLPITAKGAPVHLDASATKSTFHCLNAACCLVFNC